jgi:signal transduction histidine kinase
VTRKRQAFDASLVAVLLLVGQLEAWLGPFDRRPVLAAFSAATVLPLVLRRRRPLVVAAVVLTLFAVGQAVHGGLTETASGVLPLLVATYTAAAYEPPGRAALAGAWALTAAWASVLASPDAPTWSNFAYATLVVGVAWGVGRVLSRRHVEIADLEERTALEAAAAVRQERARIARELHDVVAHGVSVMVLQAGAADEVLDTRPDKAHEVLRSAQTTGRAALVELRRMLDLLRETEGDDVLLQPQPGLDDLHGLVERTSSAGLPTTLDLQVDGEVPPAVALSAYRVVQEALTNALKHAGPATATVCVRGTREALRVEVRDDGRGSGARSTAGGHGLVGMRERVHVFGGTLDVRSDKGWTVTATLPLTAVG